MPLLKYFRSLRGKTARGSSPANPASTAPSCRIEAAPVRGTGDELLASQRFYAEQETTRELGSEKKRTKLKKHITGIFTI